jgi:hypothetical protein
MHVPGVIDHTAFEITFVILGDEVIARCAVTVTGANFAQCGGCGVE